MIMRWLSCCPTKHIGGRMPGIVYPNAFEDISIVAAVKLACVYGLDIYCFITYYDTSSNVLKIMIDHYIIQL